MNENARRLLIQGLLLGLLVLGLYFNILDNQPTNWDDPALFSRSTIHSITAENLAKVLKLNFSSTYQPVRDLSYMLDFHFWGKDVVFGMHLHNIFLYFIMVLCCWAFLRQLFRRFDVRDDLVEIWSFMATVIYAVHPVHVESVAWLYARKEPLMGIFTFMSLWAFLKARDGSLKYGLLSVIALILAVLSKPIALATPGVMVVLDILLQFKWRDADYWKRRSWIYIPVFIFALAMIFWLVRMMWDVGGVKPWHGGNPWTNLLAVSQIFIKYILLIGFTVNYAADYIFELYADPGIWQAWAFVAANVVLLGSALWAVRGRRYIYAFFVAWHYLFLVPVSHLLPISQFMTDRYALLPSLGWCVLLGWLLAQLWVRRPVHAFFSEDFPKLLAAALMLVIVASYSFMTVRQNDIWQNSLTLWEDTLAKSPDSSSANVNLAVIYIKLGRLQEAQDLCVRAWKRLPYDYLAITNLALAQMLMEQYDNAINNYQQALALKPDLLKARMGLVNCYWLKGDYASLYASQQEMLRTGRYLKSFTAVLKYRQAYAAWKLGRPDEAAGLLEEASSSANSSPVAWKELGDIYMSMGLSARAAESYNRALDAGANEPLRIEIETLMTQLHSS